MRKRADELTWTECIAELRSGRRSIREVLPELERLLCEDPSLSGEPPRRRPRTATDEDGAEGPVALDPARIRGRGGFDELTDPFRLHYLTVPFSLWDDLFSKERDAIVEAVHVVDSELVLPLDDLLDCRETPGEGAVGRGSGPSCKHKKPSVGLQDATVLCDLLQTDAEQLPGGTVAAAGRDEW
mmetsp:Transcript_2085/g.6231  ORF Transcript_2085/g.6231 Transcript_2085/m.6231 type:complete len:184 (-) Transcript_2085:32-583(-)